MTPQQIYALVGLSVTNPPAAAQRVIGADLSRNTLWMGLLLISVLQTLLFSTLPDQFRLPEQMQPIVNNPILMAMVIAGGISIIAFVLNWSGTLIGGAGNLSPVLAVMAWMQFLRLLGTLISIVLGVFLPTLGALASLAFGVFGIYIFVSFIDVALGFNSRLKSLFLIVFSFLAVSFGTSFVLALVAALVLGMG